MGIISDSLYGPHMAGTYIWKRKRAYSFHLIDIYPTTTEFKCRGIETRSCIVSDQSTMKLKIKKTTEVIRMRRN